ncbi:MAG: nucleotide exchange factor GrpE [Alphaproteobacteria bacterium]|nr:nucleotide exchange factor GrpE [Alphaproteobacteria bacterium]
MSKHHGKTNETGKIHISTPDSGAENAAKEQALPLETGDPGTTEHVDAKDLAAEVEHLKDQMLRAMAEAENTRRRLNKELEDTRKYAVGNFAKEMLVVADNFRRALDAVPKDGAGNDSLKQLVEGVEATERQLLAGFDRFGIKKLNPMGQPFDPHFHQVMMEIDDTDHPAGTVVQVIQPGYMIHDRLLREALVAVAKGGPLAGKVDTSA